MILKKLGQGGFGEVFLGKHFLSQEEIAIKKIQFDDRVIPADRIEDVFKEARSL